MNFVGKFEAQRERNGTQYPLANESPVGTLGSTSVKSTPGKSRGFCGCPILADFARVGTLNALDCSDLPQRSRPKFAARAPASASNLSTAMRPNLIGTRAETKNAVTNLRMNQLTFSNRCRFAHFSSAVFTVFLTHSGSHSKNFSAKFSTSSESPSAPPANLNSLADRQCRANQLGRHWTSAQRSRSRHRITER